MNRSLASAAAATAALRAAPFSPLARRSAASRPASIDAGQLALFLSVEQGHLADVVQVETDGIIHVQCSQPSLSGLRIPGGSCRWTHGLLIRRSQDRHQRAICPGEVRGAESGRVSARRRGIWDGVCQVAMWGDVPEYSIGQVLPVSIPVSSSRSQVTPPACECS